MDLKEFADFMLFIVGSVICYIGILFIFFCILSFPSYALVSFISFILGGVFVRRSIIRRR